MNMNELDPILRDAGFTEAERITMLAIAAAESGLNPAAQGDPLTNYSGYWHQLYTPYAANGFLAFGLFQVFTYWHHEKLIFSTKSHNPEDWATWLFVPENNAQMAMLIYKSQGYQA